MFSGPRRFAIFAIAFLFVLALATPALAQDVVISQVYGGGGNTGAQYKNDFVELFNRGAAAVDLSTYSVQYASTAGSSWSRTNLVGSIQPGHYYLVQEAAGSGSSPALPTPDATGTLAMASGAGKIVLVANQTTLTGSCPTSVVDFVGFGTGTNCFEGTGPTATLSNITAAFRAGSGCTDSNNNAADFSTGAPNPRNSASAGTNCTAPTNPAILFALSTPATADVGATVTFTVKASPGSNPTSSALAVSASLTTIGGAANQPFFDDGTNGDAVADDKVFTYQFATGGASPNTYTLPVTLTDAQSRTASGSISLKLNAPAAYYPIHAIQGSGNTSPLNGQAVQTSGIVTSVVSNGFYLQAPDSEKDADPSTSEGIFVYSGSAPTVTVQDAVQVTGTVSEYQPSGSALSVTELTSPSVTLISHGNALPFVIAISPQPHDLIDALERYEGMLVQMATPKAVGPTGGSTASDGIFYVTASTVARPFREPGLEPGIALPSGMPANVPHFDGNFERVRVDASACNSKPAVAVGDTLPTITGALTYSGDYTLVANCPVTFSTAATVAALPVRGDGEFTVASFNMLDFTNDATRIAKASKAIRLVMREPDVIGVEEVNNLTTLQALAAKVNSDASDAPNYHAELLSTTGSQNVGFLYRGDRLTDVHVVEVGRTATFTDPRDGSQDPTNDRPPLVMMAKIVPATGVPYPVTIIVNHLRSLIDVDTVGGTGDYARAKRKAGAEYLAALISQHQAAGETVISVGDYNAYEFNDGYVDVMGTVKGQPTASDQVLLSSSDLVDPDLTDLALSLPTNLRYSYVENGNAQTLDHVVVTRALVNRPFHLEIAHNNAEFPKTLANDATRSERVSDHDMPVAYLSFPQADLVVAMTAANTTVVKEQSYTITVTNKGPDDATNVVLLDLLPAEVQFKALTAPTGWSCTTPATAQTDRVTCTVKSLASSGTAQFTLDVTAKCATPSGTTITNVAGATSDFADPKPSDRTASVVSTMSNPTPVIAGLSVDTPIIFVPDHKMVNVLLSYGVSDSCDAGLTPVVTVVSNQPVNGVGDGNTQNDWQVIDAYHVRLRAERSGDSDRVYTITVAATDSANSTTAGHVTVTVPHDQSPQ